MFNPFLANVLILYNLKIPETSVFWCFHAVLKWEHWFLAVFNISFKLTHLSRIFLFCNPWKHKESRGFQEVPNGNIGEKWVNGNTISDSIEIPTHNYLVRPVWLNGWVFVYELSGCGFESRCCHLNVRYGACFKQGVPWHSVKP